MREPTHKRLNGKVDPEFLLDFYDAWLRTDDSAKIAEALQISTKNLMFNWMKQHPILRYAKNLADSRRDRSSTLSGYVLGQLSKEARVIWDQLQFWAEGESPSDRIDKLLAGQTKRIRQELFVHALISSSFDLSEACRISRVPRAVLDHWKRDYEFRQLIEEIQWHKKNFFEHALIDLVEERHPAAVLFVNKTVNADRGYGEKLEVQHSGAVGVVGLRLEDLDLDLPTRRVILEAIRRKQELEPAALPAPPTLDVEAETEGAA